MFFNQQFNVSAIEMHRLGAYNPQLGAGDNKLFIDPKLLQLGQDEFEHSHQELLAYFANVVRTIKLIRKNGDLAWIKACKLMCFKEVSNTSLGYGEEKTDGNGIGIVLAAQIISRALEILPHVDFEPDVFELIGIFAEKIGCDRISDMIVSILRSNFLAYTDRVTRTLGIKATVEVSFDNKSYLCPKYDLKSKPVLLVPRLFLKPLPIAADFESAMDNADLNETARNEMNKLISAAEKVGKKPGKLDVLSIIRSNPSSYKEIIEGYRRTAGQPYDFDKSAFGDEESIAQEIVGKPEIKKEGLNADERVERCWASTLEHLVQSIDENRLSDCLFDDFGVPRKEAVVQRIIFSISRIFGRLYDVDISRESNSGPGAVDFRFSVGHGARLLIEVKLSTHKRIIDGYYEQLPAYGKAEGIKRLILLIVKVTEDTASIDKLLLAIEANALPIDVTIINAIAGPSASKRKHAS